MEFVESAEDKLAWRMIHGTDDECRYTNDALGGQVIVWRKMGMSEQEILKNLYDTVTWSLARIDKDDKYNNTFVEFTGSLTVVTSKLLVLTDAFNDRQAEIQIARDRANSDPVLQGYTIIEKSGGWVRGVDKSGWDVSDGYQRRLDEYTGKGDLYKVLLNEWWENQVVELEKGDAYTYIIQMYDRNGDMQKLCREGDSEMAYKILQARFKHREKECILQGRHPISAYRRTREYGDSHLIDAEYIIKIIQEKQLAQK